jgi:hypothetical protein
VKHKELSVQSEWKNMKIHSNNSRLSVTSLWRRSSKLLEIYTSTSYKILKPNVP